MNVLAIETSCDDTSCAVITDNCRLLSSVVSSQNPLHEKFGGVVPEIASRQHLENIVPVCSEALTRANVCLDDIDGICVTAGPGLVGSLLVGIMFAKGVALSSGKPFFAVNHLEGHFFAPFLSDGMPPRFPFIALIASGGHTMLYRIDGFRKYSLLSQTRDDAAGESFDKVAKILGLGYPGGVAIQNCAGEYTGSIKLPRPLEHEDDFSFSGLKTSVFNRVRKEKILSPDFIRDMAASFQWTAVEILVEKTVRIAIRNNTERLVICGGVSANRLLRREIQARAVREGLEVFIPPLEYCTDNAAMIGVVGHHFLSQGERTALSVSARPDWLI